MGAEKGAPTAVIRQPLGAEAGATFPVRWPAAGLHPAADLAVAAENLELWPTVIKL